MTDLSGRHVAVLRAEGAGDAVRDALAVRGALATTVVVATILDCADDEVRRGVGDLTRFAWVAVTSANAARRLGLWAGAWPPGTRVAAVSTATAAVVTGLGLLAPVVAPEGTAGSLGEVLDGGPVLFLAASSARDDLAGALTSRGIEVSTVVAYDVVPRALDADAVGRVLASDAIVAMAPVAVDVLCDLGPEERAAAARIPLVAIGPTTEAHAQRRGWAVARTARARAADSVADAVADVLAHAGP